MDLSCSIIEMLKHGDFHCYGNVEGIQDHRGPKMFGKGGI